ncbi:16S rRNA (guanine(527)-N(7))-methyltransferase RsmG [Palleronia marisminoris]|uniref:16S rRNA (guanine(527)-N(7))-methyltransferase RsmG n=1 Tax=Palleronia marisminoris TaxID=315423 RepID=UPI001FE1E857|nr:16S rRNA (guanine(527)-N(7))-methyltransferase RsmG [Palleronia marisminoris]
MIVSRETSAQLERLENLIGLWNPKINLVSKRTIEDLRTRHIADSIQVVEAAGHCETWADLGSGGGFPGIVVAICRPGTEVVLVEADQRKAVFLRRVVGELGLNAKVVSSRIEDIEPLHADVISARALAPLEKLIPLALRHGRPDTRYVFPKGARFREEIATARRKWRFEIDVRPSRIDKEAAILIMERIERA